MPLARLARLVPQAAHAARLARAAHSARWARLLTTVLATALAAALALHPAAAQTATPGLADDRGCAVLWQVIPVLAGSSGEPAHLRVSLRFNGGLRQQTALHLPGGWAGLTELPLQPGDAPRLRAQAGEPAWRSVAHAPGETVRLQWRLLPAGDASQGGSAQLMPSWFAFSGQGVLPMPEGVDEPGAGPACVALQGLPAGSRWASSHGTAEGTGALFVLPASPVPLAQRVQQALYAGGALQWQRAPGVVAVLPDPAPWPAQPEALARAAAHALAAQQHQWPQASTRPAPPWLLLVLPAPATLPPETALASAWHQALALQLPPAWAGDDAAVERLLTPALARAWMADRFGPLAHAGRGDAPLRAWFGEGWADFLAHRSLLREGLWSADEYAAALNARIAAYQSEPARALPNAMVTANSGTSPTLAALQALRGEWLALQWHLALRRAGHPGIEAVLRKQLVNADLARREGPISSPLATHRLVATLRSVLHDQPLRDLQLHIDQGQPFEFRPDSLGPCFVPAIAAEGTTVAATAGPAVGNSMAAYRPVPGALQQADCQGWLGLGPLADAPGTLATVADRPSTAVACKPMRKSRGKACAKARTRCSSQAVANADSNAGGNAGAKASAHAGGNGAKKSTGRAAGKHAGKSSSTSPNKANTASKASNNATGSSSGKPMKAKAGKRAR